MQIDDCWRCFYNLHLRQLVCHIKKLMHDIETFTPISTQACSTASPPPQIVGVNKILGNAGIWSIYIIPTCDKVWKNLCKQYVSRKYHLYEWFGRNHTTSNFVWSFYLSSRTCTKCVTTYLNTNSLFHFLYFILYSTNYNSPRIFFLFL